MRRMLVGAVLTLAIFTSASVAQTNLNGAGATFPYPIYSKWFNEFQKEHGGVQINYQSIGSGGGIRQLQAGTVDFGASDMPLDDNQLKDMGKTIIQLGPAIDRNRATAQTRDRLHQLHFFVCAHQADSNKAG